MRITDSKGFGQEIKKRRKELGYTQQYLSDIFGMSTSFISELENGKPTAELDKAISLAMLLGMDLELKSRDKR